jgi:hypothetical protein
MVWMRRHTLQVEIDTRHEAGTSQAVERRVADEIRETIVTWTAPHRTMVMSGPVGDSIMNALGPGLLVMIWATDWR